MLAYLCSVYFTYDIRSVNKWPSVQHQNIWLRQYSVNRPRILKPLIPQQHLHPRVTFQRWHWMSHVSAWLPGPPEVCCPSHLPHPLILAKTAVGTNRCKTSWFPRLLKTIFVFLVGKKKVFSSILTVFLSRSVKPPEGSQTGSMFCISI